MRCCLSLPLAALNVTFPLPKQNRLKPWARSLPPKNACRNGWFECTFGRPDDDGHGNTCVLGCLMGFANNDYQAVNGNPDMRGQNFGVKDTSSWDDGASRDVGGGGDGDN